MLKIKFKFFLIVILFLIILIIDKSVAISHIDEFPLFGKVIFVDAGHQSTNKPNVNRTSCSK